MESGGIFGPKLSGKTTLAIALSQDYWRRFKMRSLVLDINLDTWGKQAWVTNDENKFWKAVWNSRNSLVIVDEATETINRDKDLVPVFTRLRHLNHKLLVIGHSGVNLLPIMREQLDTLYLFRQSKKAAAMWSEAMTQEGFNEATTLSQYEFLFGTNYIAPQKMTLPPPRVTSK